MPPRTAPATLTDVNHELRTVLSGREVRDRALADRARCGRGGRTHVFGAGFDPLNALFVAVLTVLSARARGCPATTWTSRESRGDPPTSTRSRRSGLWPSLPWHSGCGRFGWSGMGFAGLPPVDVDRLVGRAHRRGDGNHPSRSSRSDGSLGLTESAFLHYMFPQSQSRRRRLFAAVSLSAGVGEEVVFRSYLIAALVLGHCLPLWTAVLLAAVFFAAIHAYQGGLGMVRTAVLGVTLSLPLVVVGSIWPAMIAHTAIDLLAGLVWAERLTDPERTANGD